MDRRAPQRTLVVSNNSTLYNRGNPFSFTYGTEAVIPVEIGASSFRAEIPIEGELNNEMLREELDLLEELRDGAALREASL
ncbi:hypothetical protein A2U01_0087591, partial [Trifolium medium]|nr:hypothetical protein [Trifolium medium]